MAERMTMRDLGFDFGPDPFYAKRRGMSAGQIEKIELLKRVG